MKKELLISIIIPVYNTSLYIEKCINSVYNQTYSNKEIIVIDDGSNDETKEKLNQLSSKINILLHQENKGQSSARNLGIKKATGKYIIFIDSDDFVETNFCEKLITNFNTNYSVVTCFANVLSIKNKSKIFKPKGDGLEKALLNNTALGTSLFVKEDLLSIGGYDENMRTGFEDWDLLIRLLNFTNKKIFVVKEPLYNYRKGIVSTTTKANKVKYDLLKYIYSKNEAIFKEHFLSFILFLLSRIEKEEQEKNKNLQRLEFKIGSVIFR